MQNSDRQALAQVIAQRLRELRARANLTQEQIASRLGCHESAISRWEAGTRLPPATDILALAELYEVSVDSLLGREETPVPASLALVDQALLDRLAQVRSVNEFDEIVEARAEQTAWLPVPPGAVLVTVEEAMRRARLVADRFKTSRYADRLFRPRA